MVDYKSTLNRNTDYREHSRSNVDTLLDSLLNDNGFNDNDNDNNMKQMESALFDSTGHAEDFYLSPKDSNAELGWSVSAKTEDPMNLITFNMSESMPLQFSLSSASVASSSSSASPFTVSEKKTYSLKSKSPLMKKDEPKESANITLQERSAMLESGPFVCHYCDASFRMRGYLTRHIKKHAIEKAYKCPFFSKDAPPELRCHNSGGFSRRDTYKTHLKARHILFPNGVKPHDRNKSSGHCAQCGEFFQNIENWVELHIESGDCTGLPTNYVRNVKSERKSGKLKMIKTSNGHSRFISTAKSVIEPSVLLNEDAIEAMAIVANTSNSKELLTRSMDDKLLMNTSNFSNVKNKHNSKTNVSFRVPHNDEYIAPLDMEQSSSDLSVFTSETNNLPMYIEETMEDFDLKELYEKDFSETREYLNLYRKTFGSGI